MSLAYPYMLLLAPLPFLMRLMAPASVVAGLRVAPHMMAGIVPRPRINRNTLAAAVAWIALVIALAGPQVMRPSDLITASGRDIVLAMDLSGSMEKQDFHLDGQPISRLDAVKKVASRLIASRQGDRIGLVIFGDRSYFAQPLTFDVQAVADALGEAQIGVSGRSTAISDGLGLAMKRLVRSDSPSRVIVLFSDGTDTSGTVDSVDAAQLAARNGIRIHTVALGPEDLETAPTSRDAVDSETLRKIAAQSGGTTFRVREMADLEQMAQALNSLEPNPTERPPMLYAHSLWPWPASVALLTMLLIVWRRP